MRHGRRLEVDEGNLLIGPVGADQPEGWPGPAACRHMCDVKHEKAGVVGFVAREADTTTPGCRGACVVYAPLRKLGVLLKETLGLGSALVEIVDEAVCGVTRCVSRCMIRGYESRRHTLR